MTARIYSPGSLVRARGREWIVLNGSDAETLRLRPVSGSEEGQTLLHLALETDPVTDASFLPRGYEIPLAPLPEDVRERLEVEGPSGTVLGEAQIAFEALSIEGGLLSPSLLARVAQQKADAQSDQDYRIRKGQNLRDEID